MLSCCPLTNGFAEVLIADPNSKTTRASMILDKTAGGQLLRADRIRTAISTRLLVFLAFFGVRFSSKLDRPKLCGLSCFDPLGVSV